MIGGFKLFESTVVEIRRYDWWI